MPHPRRPSLPQLPKPPHDRSFSASFPRATQPPPTVVPPSHTSSPPQPLPLLKSHMTLRASPEPLGVRSPNWQPPARSVLAQDYLDSRLPAIRQRIDARQADAQTNGREAEEELLGCLRGAVREMMGAERGFWVELEELATVAAATRFLLVDEALRGMGRGVLTGKERESLLCL
ncbi:hypothetical protein BU16DRAFT_566042 [Lophium mytilinum]|uniref:Uncharacterized protein n=1 Tax=Lophium mytilinum TaxID=390894 RepID=A0A6A6QG90_9PEZI|nr:hypothetical protein BU16DRAFT_566042 [Lophium mytilinum]